LAGIYTGIDVVTRNWRTRIDTGPVSKCIVIVEKRPPSSRSFTCGAIIEHPETTAASQAAEDAHRGIFSISKPTGIYAAGKAGVVVEHVPSAWIAGKAGVDIGWAIAAETCFMTGMDGHDELLSVPQSIIIVVVSSDGENDISSALIVEEGLLELVISIPFIILLAVSIVLIRGIRTAQVEFFSDRSRPCQSRPHLSIAIPLRRTTRVSVDLYDHKDKVDLIVRDRGTALQLNLHLVVSPKVPVGSVPQVV
jgi:hypothetical protein